MFHPVIAININFGDLLKIGIGRKNFGKSSKIGICAPIIALPQKHFDKIWRVKLWQIVV